MGYGLAGPKLAYTLEFTHALANHTPELKLGEKSANRWSEFL